MGTALEGVNVVEFSSNLAVAYAAMLLAEQGAVAIKVEPPGGISGRGAPHFHALNRGKRSVFADLDSATGKSVFESLIKRADIVMAGATPGSLQARGLDYPSIHRINPRALALYMPPLGSRGPFANLDAREELISALGGIAGDQWARSGNPVQITSPLASYSTGILGASAAVAALVGRGSNGMGQSIEVSLLAGAFSLQTGSIMRHEKMTSLYQGPQDPLGPVPCYRLFEASDGRYFFVACGNLTFWNKFTLAIERPELVSDPRFDNAPWGIASDDWQPLKDILEPIIRTKPRDEWLRILRENDVPCAPVLTRQEFIDWPQTIELGMRREINDPTLGATVQSGLSITLNGTPGQIKGPAPALASDGVSQALEVLDSNARTASKTIPAQAGRGGPLAGTLVLDFCSYIAGSYGPMLLAQMGADVIKIENPGGDAFRQFGFGFIGWNQAKRALALDFNSPEALEILYRLVDKADMVVENLRPGRMKRFGLDYETLAARNPRLIYMSVNAFGNHGPEHNQPGFDPLLQARSGVMAAQGGPHGHPVYLTCAICDYGAAMLSALGCVTALRARQVSGRGQFCESSLLQAAMAMQAGEFIFYKDRPDMENGAAEYRGPSALVRCYECREGQWLAIAVESDAQWDALRRMAGLDTPFAEARREPTEGRLATALAGVFINRDRDETVAALNRAGVPATPVNRFPDLFNDPQVTANELMVDLQHSEWGRVTQTGILAKFSETPGRIDRAAPLLGEHSEEILREYLGYSAEQIADLRARNILRVSSPQKPE